MAAQEWHLEPLEQPQTQRTAPDVPPLQEPCPKGCVPTTWVLLPIPAEQGGYPRLDTFDSSGKVQNLSGVSTEMVLLISFHTQSPVPWHSSAPGPSPPGGFGSKPRALFPFSAGTKTIEVSLSGKKPGWIPLSPLPCALTMPDSVWWAGQGRLPRDPNRIQSSGNGPLGLGGTSSLLHAAL